MTARYLGLTWDHPRGFDALSAAEHEVAQPGLLHWERQPLEGFESHPIGELAARYDLLVLDHPHIGEAVALDCLLPLEQLFAVEEVSAWSASTMGAAMASYRWQGSHWALPLDVATQVAAYRPTQLAEPPATWDEVVRLCEVQPVGLSIAGPHAILCFFSIVLALGREPGGDDLVDDATGGEALAMLRRIYQLTPAFSRSLNPIGLLEAMAAGGPLTYVPLVYGYVNYAVPRPDREALGFAEAPLGPSGRRGSILGGTGIALTRRAQPDRALLDHLRWLLSEDAQMGFIPRRNGQPSGRRAWASPTVNGAWGGFYAATAATTEAAWVRPRFDGYIAFQTAAAAIIRTGLAANDSSPAILSPLRDAWHHSRQAARATLSTKDKS